MEDQVNYGWHRSIRCNTRHTSSSSLSGSIVMQIPPCTTNLCRKSLSDPDNVLASWDPNLVNPCAYFHIACNLENHVTRIRCRKMVFQPCRMVPRIGEDRISSLPDVTLSEILSLLPTKEAVATSVLSKRWRHVFSGITSLDFDCSPISHCSHSKCMTERFPSFINFVDRVLLARQAENISTFRLKLYHSAERYPLEMCCEKCFPDLDPLLLTSWIRFPLTHSVRQFELCAFARSPSKLPSDIFCCSTLEVLKLETNLELEFPKSLCLPNVKVLHLRLYDIHGDSVNKLISSCPSQEELVLSGEWTTGDSLIISAPCLRRLVMAIHITESPLKSNVVLDTPQLEYLDYIDTFAWQYTIANMNGLEEAHLCMQWWRECSPEITLLRFVPFFSNVRSLSLLHQCTEVLEMCGSDLLKHKLPVFGNLRHLKLGVCGYTEWSFVLIDLLNCSPLLETLTFIEGIGSLEGARDEVVVPEIQYWRTTQIVPVCLRLHLRSVAIDYYNGSEEELLLIRYFLKNASLLEELVITCPDRIDMISLGSSLQNLPRSSMSCSINIRKFLGFTYYAPFSRND